MSLDDNLRYNLEQLSTRHSYGGSCGNDPDKAGTIILMVLAFVAGIIIGAMFFALTHPQ